MFEMKKNAIKFICSEFNSVLEPKLKNILNNDFFEFSFYDIMLLIKQPKQNSNNEDVDKFIKTLLYWLALAKVKNSNYIILLAQKITDNMLK